MGPVLAALLSVAGPSDAAAPPPPLTASMARSAPDILVAVMPFATAGADDDWGTVADGFTRHIGDDLARLPGTLVISPDSSRAVGAPGLDAVGFGRTLGARYVVAGSLEPAAGQVRVTAALYDIDAGSQLWSSDDRDDRMRLGALAQTLALRVARTADVAMLDEAARQSFYGHVTDATSEDFSIRGLALLNRSLSRDGLDVARRHFVDALARDDANVDALTGLAHINQRLAATPGWSTDSPADFAEGLRLVGRALALDPHNGYAHFVRGILLSGRGRIEAADAEFQDALAVNYSFAPAHAFGGYNRMFLGHAEATLPAVTMALTISPRDPNLSIWYFFAGAGELLLGHDQAAIMWLEKSRAANRVYTTPYVWLAAAYGLTGRSDEAAANLTELRRLARDFGLARFRAQWVDRSDNAVFRGQIARVVAGLKAGGIAE